MWRIMPGLGCGSVEHIVNRPYFVYLLRCADGSLYTGITNDLERRLKTHNEGRGSRYVRLHRPARLAWSVYAGSRSSALKLEYRIKTFTRARKERLIAKQIPPKFRDAPISFRFFHL